MFMSKRQSAFNKALQEAQKGDTSKQSDSQTSEHSDIQPLEQPNITTQKHTASPTDSKRIKRTYYLAPEAIAAVTSEQTKRLLASGKQTEVSDLVTEAILAYYRR